MSSSVAELAWAAGFLDGEGCIQLVHRKGEKRGAWVYSKVNLTATNTDLRALLELRRLFGGSIHESKGKTRRLRCWQWHLNTRQAADALQLLVPYLRIKREQAELALEFQATMGVPGTAVSSTVMLDRQSYVTRIKALKRPNQGDVCPNQGDARKAYPKTERML